MKKKLIAGVDEVGRGCIAGPVVSAAVILKHSINLNLLKDSKKISFNKREKIAEHIKDNSYYAIGTASVDEILNLNILQASLLSMVNDTLSAQYQFAVAHCARPKAKAKAAAAAGEGASNAGALSV